MKTTKEQLRDALKIVQRQIDEVKVKLAELDKLKETESKLYSTRGSYLEMIDLIDKQEQNRIKRKK